MILYEFFQCPPLCTPRTKGVCGPMDIQHPSACVLDVSHMAGGITQNCMVLSMYSMHTFGKTIFHIHVHLATVQGKDSSQC